MTIINLLFHAVSIGASLYLLHLIRSLQLRVSKLEQKPKAPVTVKPTEPVKPEPKPISKFNPAPVETLLPKGDKSFEVAPGVFEFK